MAEFDPALNFMLNNEDRNRQYACVPDACPAGCKGPCYAIAGINSGAFPREFMEIAALPQVQRGAAVATFYESEFWVPMKLAELASQDLANRVLDSGVNEGPETAVRLLQGAANTLGAVLTVDGSIGPVTIAAVNDMDPERMLDEYRQARLHRYIEIAAKEPADARYLSAWEARALA